jgi:hypothetical protein
MDIEPTTTSSIKAEKIRIQIHHLQTKYELDRKLREAKFQHDLRKLELSLLQLEGSN